MKASATIKSTGEVVDMPADTAEQVIDSLRLAQEYRDAYLDIEKQLKKRAAQLIDEQGGPLEHDGWLVRSYTTQRMSYDRAVLRDVFDPDLLDLFLEPVKTRIDSYLADHLEELGADSTRLRTSMVPVGKAFTVTRLERLDRRDAA